MMFATIAGHSSTILSQGHFGASGGARVLPSGILREGLPSLSSGMCVGVNVKPISGVRLTLSALVIPFVLSCGTSPHTPCT